MLADTPERLEFLKTTVAKGRYLGMATEIISVTEAKNYFPFIEDQHFIGALLDPNEGHLDPSGTTYAYAKAAKLGGATIEVQTMVEGLELLQPDLDRIAPSLEVAFQHFPKLESVGIKPVINGPFTFAPDGNPLVGPVRGRTNFWSACGVMAGFSQGGGVGLALSNWMVDGDPGFDIWGMDVARYGDWATRTYTSAACTRASLMPVPTWV